MFTNLAFTNWVTTARMTSWKPPGTSSCRGGSGPDGRGQLAGTGRHSGFPAEIHQAWPYRGRQ